MNVKITSPQLLRGIDVSMHQKSIDWPRVKAAGICFAFIKATEGGDFLDQYFSDNWKNARTAGVTRGAYHFFRPKTAVQLQVDNFVNTVKQLAEGDLPPVLDLEVPNDWVGISQPDRVAIIVEWLTKVEAALGVRPIVYMSPSFVTTVLAGDASALSGHKLWIANYGVPTPAVPHPLSFWTVWQYSDNGTVDGIDGAVDLDWYNGSNISFQALTVTRSRSRRLWRKLLCLLLSVFGIF